jgi:hypothetical protein
MQEIELGLDAFLVPGAKAKLQRDHECFSNFDTFDEFDHIRIDFDSRATEGLRQCVGRDGFRLERVIPRISAHGYLSLTSVFAIDDSIPLIDVEALGVKLALLIDTQLELFDGICRQLEQARILEFPYRYRFGVPEALEKSSHTPIHALSLNQHVLLPDQDELEQSARAMRLDENTLVVDGFRVMSGWSMFLWAPEEPYPPDRLLDRFTRLVTLDNVLAVQLTVLACGLSAANAFMGNILRDDPRISAWSVRDTYLVHHRIAQKMKLRERELLENQKTYVRGQFERSDYEDLRGAYARAEGSLLSAAEGMEAARQQRTSALTNVILWFASVLGALTIVTAAVDFAYLLPENPPPLVAADRALLLIGLAALLLALACYGTRLILLASEQRARRRGNRRRWSGLVVRFFGQLSGTITKYFRYRSGNDSLRS